jgi:indolepyruvate ferredoxin oxidoreductase
MINNPLTHAANPAVLRDYQLMDNVWASQGVVFLSGTQALVRLVLMQRRYDESQQWNTRGFIATGHG